MPTDQPRILIYSHDSFGLGHLRRCRAIAHSMVGAMTRLSVIILSGSPIIGSFDFRPRVDFVRVPGVIKTARRRLLLPLAAPSASRRCCACARRSSSTPPTSSIRTSFIVDKEPLGLRGEVEPTLRNAEGSAGPGSSSACAT